ncbi:MAG: glycosyltransferase family 4 protein [Bacteroidetes bacterium]|nr:glycosyltransferase family 4 protein [Bacteroidota bacterium]
MKVLVISHAAIQRSWQKKFAEITKDQSIQITLLLPKYWIENYHRVRVEINTKSKLNYVVGKTVWKGFSNRYFFLTKFCNLLKTLQPDIIHLEQEPWSLIALQTAFYRNCILPKCRIIFRTSRSFEGQLKLPWLAATIEKYTYKNSEFAFPLSKRAAQLLERRGYKNGIEVIPNGVDTDLFRKLDATMIRKSLGIDSAFTIGYIGRFVKEKGLGILLKAVGGIDQDFRLLFVGDGPYKNDLINLSNRLGINEKLHLVETIPADQIPLYLNFMDVLVLPSYKTGNWEEFFGRVLIEAMACEVTVIGSDSGEIPNVIGRAGLIFKSKNVDSLRIALERVMDDDDFRWNLSKMGRALVKNYYSWERIAEKTKDVYFKLIGKKQLCDTTMK